MNAATGPPTDSSNTFVAQHARTYAETGGEQGHIWEGIPTLLLTTTGRTTRIPRRTVLIYGRDRSRYLVVASNLGAHNHPDWYLNLLRTPQVTIQVRDEILIAHAQPADDAQRHRWWSIMVALWPEYEKYRAGTSRVIPIVALQPIAPAAPAPSPPTRTEYAPD